MKRLIAAAILLTVPAFGQQAPPDTEMVLVPRAVAEQAAQWIAQPNAGNAVMLYASLEACIKDNPHDGKVERIGQDLCPAVTAAIAARAKEIAALKAGIPAAPAKK